MRTSERFQNAKLDAARALHANPSPNSPLKIVHVTASVDPAAGGPATVIVRLAAAQAMQGHDVTIISSLNPHRREIFEDSVAAVPGFPRVRLALSPAKLTWPCLLKSRAWSDLNPLIFTADALHLHGVWDPVLFAAARIAHRAGIPYILRPCGMLDPWCLQHHHWRKRAALWAGIRRMLQSAASLHLLNDAESFLIAPLRLNVPAAIIPNGVFLEEIRGTRHDEFFDLLPPLRAKPYILFLSRLHYKKGLDLLGKAFIDLAQRLPDIDLVVAGPDGGARAAFKKQIAEGHASHRVHMVGALYGNAKLSALRNAACFCLPSRQEGFSLAVTEALACGIPVAISHETHFPEVALAGAGLLFDLHPPAIAAQLEHITRSSPAERQKMGAAGQKLVEQRFTWPKIAQRTIALYNDALHPLKPPIPNPSPSLNPPQ